LAAHLNPQLNDEYPNVSFWGNKDEIKTNLEIAYGWIERNIQWEERNPAIAKKIRKSLQKIQEHLINNSGRLEKSNTKFGIRPLR
jgi:hypothetical protein